MSAGTVLAQMHLEKLRNFTQLSGIQEPIYVLASTSRLGAASIPQPASPDCGMVKMNSVPVAV